ncbi:c-type cytochrome biogenesis protein CcsB, partial [Paraburkholderia hospita]
MDLTQVSSSSRAKPRADMAAHSAPHLTGEALLDERPFLKRLGLFDWLFALAMIAGAGFALSRYHDYMNYYDKLVLVCTVPVFVVLGWRWKPVRLLMACIAVLSLSAIQIYGGDLARADHAFFL